MKEFIQQIKKISFKKGDLFVVKTDVFGMSDASKSLIADTIHEVNKDVPCLFLHLDPKSSFRKEGPTQGKHKVYLNNLEYLEYLDKQKGLDK
jgi:hypothetical protein